MHQIVYTIPFPVGLLVLLDHSFSCWGETGFSHEDDTQNKEGRQQAATLPKSHE